MRDLIKTGVWRFGISFIFFVAIILWGLWGSGQGGLVPHALAAQGCAFDYDMDNDVDGLDLLEFTRAFDPGDLAGVALEFGKTCSPDCRDFLPCQVGEANQCFAQISGGTDPVPKTFHAVTRIISLVYDPAINDLLTDLGMEEQVRELCNWTADWPRDTQGNPILPPVLPSPGQALDILIAALLPQVEGALTQLSGIDGTIPEPFIVLCDELMLPHDGEPCEDIEVDFGDVAIYRAMLQGLKAFLLMADAYNWDVTDTAEVIDRLKRNIFVINDYLCTDDPDLSHCLPDFMKKDANAQALLAQAKSSLQDAIASYMEASAFIRAEKDDQEDDLISFPRDPEGIAEEEDFRAGLNEIRCAMAGPCAMTRVSPEDHFYLDLTRFFDYPLDLRDYLPGFTDSNQIICGSFETELGGILPDFGSDRWADFLEIPVAVAGQVSMAGAITSGNILVDAFVCSFEPGRILDYLWCDNAGSASLSSLGGYEMALKAGSENIRMVAFWDRDSNAVPSPGDLFGFYPDNPFNVSSMNCAGPSGIDLTLSETISGIKGRVASQGQPLANAWVHAYESGCGNWLRSIQSDSGGYFAISDLPSGGVSLHVYGPPDNQYVYGWWTGLGVSHDCNEAATYNPAPGNVFVEIDLEKSGSITGRVTREDNGQSIQGLWVYAHDWDTGNGMGSSETDSKGEYHVPGLVPGKYRVCVSTDENQYYLTECYDDVRDYSSALAVHVTAGQPTSNIDFSLTMGGGITGLVTDASGTPLQNIWVSAYDFGTGSWVRQAQTGADGMYLISGLAQGSYRVSAYSPDYVYTYYDDVQIQSAALPVNVAKGADTQGIDFSLEQRP